MTAAAVDPPEYQHPQPGDPNALEFDFASLHSTLNRMGDDIPARLEHDTAADSAVLLLHDLTEAWRQLGSLKAFAEAECVKRLRYGRNEVAGFIAEVKGGRKRTEWRHDDLAWAAVREFTVDGDGVMDEFRSDLVGKVRDRLLNCARPDWRVNALREVGIDPNDYCHTETGRKTVIVSPATEEPT